MIPCMGGFCYTRDRCANYYADSDIYPVERLCGEVEEPEPLLPSMRRMDGDKIHSQVGGDISASEERIESGLLQEF